MGIVKVLPTTTVREMTEQYKQMAPVPPAIACTFEFGKKGRKKIAKPGHLVLGYGINIGDTVRVRTKYQLRRESPNCRIDTGGLPFDIRQSVQPLIRG